MDGRELLRGLITLHDEARAAGADALIPGIARLISAVVDDLAGDAGGSGPAAGGDDPDVPAIADLASRLAAVEAWKADQVGFIATEVNGRVKLAIRPLRVDRDLAIADLTSRLAAVEKWTDEAHGEMRRLVAADKALAKELKGLKAASGVIPEDFRSEIKRIDDALGVYNKKLIDRSGEINKLSKVVESLDMPKLKNVVMQLLAQMRARVDDLVDNSRLNHRLDNIDKSIGEVISLHGTLLKRVDLIEHQVDTIRSIDALKTRANGS